MHLLKPLTDDYSRLSGIYEKIFLGNAVAFLGAGASVSNNQYLSKDIIPLYQSRISKDFGTTDITKFVDILQATPGQWRSDFDSFVIEQLAKLTPNAGHQVLVTIPWKQIVTTNFDTLVEEASEKAIKEHKTHFHLKTIRNKSQLDYQTGNNEISYIKLNGCKSDLSSYPLVFSTDDFAKQLPYYKKVLGPFKQFSSDIMYLAFGYSFSDEFSEKLLERILNVDFRQKRPIYCIDPFINIDKLDYYQSKGIYIINISFEDFFLNYQKWFVDNHRDYLKNLQKFTNPDNTLIEIDTNARLYLDKNLVQLKDDYRAIERMKKVDFYTGSEPNYQVIIDGFDVVKSDGLKKLLQTINESFNGHSRTTIPKLILVNGDFGSGKTTFTLRAIKEYVKNNKSTLAFEITRGIGIKKGYLAQLIKESAANQFIFYCDNIETDSVFKRFNEIRVDLATEQYSDISIVFISSIRENILAKFKSHEYKSIANCVEFSYDATYNDSELSDLIDNLKDVGLLAFRDLEEKKSIIYNLKRQYKGDSFITLYKLIEHGTHYRLLQKAYGELTPVIQTAFKVTALIHRFNMYCPVSILKNSIKNMEWDEFTENVIRGDGKKILFQEKRSSTNSDPDLFFKTKHPIIAEALVKTILKNSEKNALYKSIFASLTLSDFNAGFIVDLIKNIRNYDTDITEGQIDNYYDICKKEFERSPHFMLSFITNIEKKSNQIKTLEQCIRDIEILEGSLDYRNSRLIHRKGSLNFKIARLLYQENGFVEDVKQYLHISEEWFMIKKKMDPSSRYSYFDYFKMLIWKLKNIKLNEEEKLELHLNINHLFDEAFKLIESDYKLITDLFEEYNLLRDQSDSNEEYLDFLLDRYQDVETRPLACILLYYYYDDLNDYKKTSDLIDELKKYSDNKDVVYFLFKYYGKNLHNSNNRIRYFELIRYNDFLKDLSPMRYFYFSSICEAYDRRWRDCKEFQGELKNFKASILNPDFFMYWREDDGDEKIFEGEITMDGTIKKVKIFSLYKEFPFVKGSYNKYSSSQKVTVKLRFFFDGIRAEIS